MGHPEIRKEDCNFKNTICQFTLPTRDTIPLLKPIEIYKTAATWMGLHEENEEGI